MRFVLLTLLLLGFVCLLWVMRGSTENQRDPQQAPVSLAAPVGEASLPGKAKTKEQDESPPPPPEQVAGPLPAPQAAPVQAGAERDEKPELIEKVAVANERVYCAVKLDNGILAVLSPHRLFTCRTSDIRGILDTHWRPTRTASALASHGNSLYVPDQKRGALEVFTVTGEGRISKTAILREGSRSRIPVVRAKRLYDIALHADTQAPTLFIYSLDTPATPSLLHSTPMPGMEGVPSAFRIVGDRLYCVRGQKLWAFGVAGSGEVDLLGQLALETNNLPAGGLAVDGNHAYVYTGHKLSTFDVSRPAEMRRLSVQDFPYLPISLGNAKGFFSMGTSGLLELIYPSDRSEGVARGSRDEGDGLCLLPGAEGGFTVRRDGSVVTRSFGEVRPIPILGASARFSLLAANDHLYALGNDFQVLDIRDPHRITEVARRRGAGFSPPRFRPAFRAGLIYTTNSVIDVRQPSDPRVVERYGRCSSLSIHGSLMYRLVGKDYVVSRIRDDRPMQELFAGTLAGEEVARHVLVTAKHVFVASGRKRIVCYLIGKHLSLARLSDFELPGGDPYTMDMMADDNMLYVAMNGAGVACFDISDPENPTLHSSLDTSQFSEKVYVVGGRVFTAEGSGGILAIDMRGPGKAAVLSEYQTCGWTDGLAVYKGHVYSLEGNAGIGVFRCRNLADDEPGDVAEYLDNTPQFSAAEAEGIDAVIDALGATTFRTRKEAHGKLAAMLPDEALLEHLKRRLKEEKDPEIQERLRELTK